MKITKQYLTQIIKEEIEELLRLEEVYGAVPNYRETLKSYKPFIDKYKNIPYQELLKKDLEEIKKLYAFSEESYEKLLNIYNKNKNNSNSRDRNEEGQGEAAAMDRIRDAAAYAWREKTKHMSPEPTPKLSEYAGLSVDDFV